MSAGDDDAVLRLDGHGAVVVDGVEDFAELLGGRARTSMRAWLGSSWRWPTRMSLMT